VESTQTIEPESPPCPACHRGVLRREVEPDPSLRSASRFSARESAVLASLAVQYVFSPGLLDDVEKLSSHATCAATRHARPAPSVMVRRTSALDAGQSRTNWKRRAYFWASSENGPRQTPKTPLFGLSRDRRAVADQGGCSIFRYDARRRLRWDPMLHRSKEQRSVVSGRRSGTTEHERRELPALTGFSGPRARSPAAEAVQHIVMRRRLGFGSTRHYVAPRGKSTRSYSRPWMPVIDSGP
jgi:hypothetical protein